MSAGIDLVKIGNSVLNRKKILHITKVLDKGGAENHLLILCKGLIQRDFDVSVGYWAGRGTLASDFAAAGVKVNPLQIRNKVDPLNVLRFARFIRKQNPDILHTHLPLTELFGNLAGVVSRVPIIVSTKHNDDQFFKNGFIRLLHYVMSLPNDRIIAISDYVREYTRSIGVRDEDRLITIRYGIETELFDEQRGSSKRNELRTEFLGSGRLLIGTVARLEPQKGLSVLLNAIVRVAQEFPDSRFIVVGEGTLRKELVRQSQSLGISAYVSFLGKRDDVAEILGSLDVFVLPSLWEGFGLVLLEAMAASRPIVASNVSAIPEVLKNGYAGILVPPGDPGELSSAILQLLGDENLRSELGRRGKELVEREFQAATMISATAALYDDLLSSKCTPTQDHTTSQT